MRPPSPSSRSAAVGLPVRGHACVCVSPLRPPCGRPTRVRAGVQHTDTPLPCVPRMRVHACVYMCAHACAGPPCAGLRLPAVPGVSSACGAGRDVNYGLWGSSRFPAGSKCLFTLSQYFPAPPLTGPAHAPPAAAPAAALAPWPRHPPPGHGTPRAAAAPPAHGTPLPPSVHPPAGRAGGETEAGSSGAGWGGHTARSVPYLPHGPASARLQRGVLFGCFILPPPPAPCSPQAPCSPPPAKHSPAPPPTVPPCSPCTLFPLHPAPPFAPQHPLHPVPPLLPACPLPPRRKPAPHFAPRLVPPPAPALPL